MKYNRLVTFLAVLGVALAAAAGAPKYIFYFIGDGMGMGPVMAAETYNRMVLGNANTLNMISLPYGGSARTYSASSPVTDSAAAGTALSTGNKTRNGMLGMGPDTVAVQSIAEDLRKAGYGIGLVTDCAADDATPGAFYAHVPNRAMYYEVGVDAATSGIDFLAGASLRGDKDKKTGKATDLYDVLAQNGIRVYRGADGARSIIGESTGRVVLLNPPGYGNPSELGYEIDSVGTDGVGLTLSLAMDACLAHLQRNSPERFFMMVEGGLIDHSLHGDDGTTAVRQVLAFDALIGRALEFYRQHPDETLIVITADHDTGGMSVSNKHTGYMAYPQNVDAQRQSKAVFSDYCVSLLRDGKIPTWKQMQAYLTEKMGLWGSIKLTDAQTEELHKAFETTFVQHAGKDEKGLYKTSNAFATSVYRVYNDCTGWGFTTTHHTGNPVPVFAIGDGAEVFARMQNNTEIPAAILRLALGK